MNPLFDHRFLNQYLDGKMSPVELEAFEKRLAKEPVLRAELNAMKRDRGMEMDAPEVVEQATKPVEKSGFNAWLLILGLLLVLLIYWLTRVLAMKN